MILLLALVALPYGYLVVYWSGCLVTGCRFDGHMLFYSFVALMAAPFVMLMIGGGVMMGGAGRLRAAASPGLSAPAAAKQATGGTLRFAIGLVLLVTALPTCGALFYYMLYTPEEGRDQLGRICETNGSRTTCRPDPEADHPTELEMINAARKRKQWFAPD
jgi:hypothetical protein